MEIKKISFEIEGIAPLLMARFHEKAQESVKTPKRTRYTEEDRMKEVELSCYKDDEEELVIPSYALKACLINAVGDLAQRMKKGSEKQLYLSSIFIKPTNLLLGKKKYDFIDERRVVNPNTRGAQMCKRPGITEGWKVKGEFHIVDPLITDASLKERLAYAGMRFGLLSNRPEFGRFIIKQFNGRKIE